MGWFFKTYCDVCHREIKGKYTEISGMGRVLYNICLDCKDKYITATQGKFPNGDTIFPVNANDVLEVISNSEKSAEILQKLVDSNGEVKIEKSLQSIADYIGGFSEKNLQNWINEFSNILVTMSDEEEILHAFKCSIIDINKPNESVVGCVCLISNRRFYYVGAEGKAILTYFKSGTIELKDVHAITLGASTLTTPPYVKFEVKNDNYQISTFENTNLIKCKLEEGIRLCESIEKQQTVVQNGFSSADEIKKYKELLDSGVITQEEFDAKKKQLLGL